MMVRLSGSRFTVQRLQPMDTAPNISPIGLAGLRLESLEAKKFHIIFASQLSGFPASKLSVVPTSQPVTL